MPRDDEDDLPPKRARRRDDDEYDDDRPDATGGLIPYKNGKALAAYYCGVFALIPCVGALLGPLALVFGFLGLAHAKKYPEARGKGHAIAGIVLGAICSLLWIVGPIVLMALGYFKR